MNSNKKHGNTRNLCLILSDCSSTRSETHVYFNFPCGGLRPRGDHWNFSISPSSTSNISSTPSPPQHSPTLPPQYSPISSLSPSSSPPSLYPITFPPPSPPQHFPPLPLPLSLNFSPSLSPPIIICLSSIVL